MPNSLAHGRPLSARPGDKAMMGFFGLHIAVTCIVAVQCLFPGWTRTALPNVLQDALTSYIRDSDVHL
ncbi:hypothetical protein HDU83_007097, partial [Entophlyctis luteolus]